MTEFFAISIVVIAFGYILMPIAVMIFGLVYAVVGTLFNFISRK